jgi:CRISPR-associated endonuclease/helicase Cas3
MKTEISSYEDFFRMAFGNEPFDYQEQLAKENEDFPSLLNAPTGAGKTNAVLGAWLWRRLRNPESVGRRLIYCLPMRTLVEQTRDVVKNALENLRKAKLIELNDLSVHILYGGDVSNDWDIYPERQQIIIGTQDLLLSRALNRGYAMSRYKWTVPFGLLNNDCLWVIDEVQLLGSGLATTLQLQSFRRTLKTFGKTQTIWMSATMESDWLKTADFNIELDAPCTPLGKPLGLSDKDFANEKLGRRWTAIKNLKQAESKAGEIEKLVREIITNHQANSMTLVIVNTVKRARELHKFLQEKRNGKETLLIHSRFRLSDRNEKIKKLFDVKKTEGADAIVVTTQVVEAGVDVSAKTLFTELAPWASLVQRFGRCNRGGEHPDGANVLWIDVPQSKKENLAPPYDETELTEARKAISSMQNVSPKLLDEYRKKLTTQERSNLFRYEHTHVIRQHDLHGLFSNERDLAGGFTDISHFVRNRERNPDVQIYWKYFKQIPSDKIPRPRHDELCAVRFYDLQKFLDPKGAAWEWNGEKGADQKGGWEKRMSKDIRPGMTLLLSVDQGGYSEEYGWTGNPKDKPKPVGFDFDTEPNESLNDDQPSQTDWLALSAHLRDAEAEAEEIVQKIAEELGNDFLETGQSVIKAAWWHDTGKTYPGWQKAVEKFCNGLSEKAETYLNQNSDDEKTAFVKNFLAEVKTLPVEIKPWAKFPDLYEAVKKSSLAPKAKREVLDALNVPFRPNMRHEAASALTAWQEWQSEKEDWTALAVFLVACHHGKVRTVLRSTGKGDDVFGIKQADTLPALPEWLEIETELNIEPRTIGVTGEWDGDVFKVAAPSWIGMIAELLGPELPDDPQPCDVIPLHEPRNLGVFRLAYLEALIRAADVKASRNPGKGGLNE